MDLGRAESKALWESSADAWLIQVERDRNRSLVLDPVMVALCGEGASGLALDVGCGEGRFCRMLRQGGWRTVGLDIVPKFVETAHQRDADGSYVQANAERLPFQTGSFDLVVSYVTLVDFPDFRTAVSEMARTLRVGGRLVVSNCSPLVTSSPSPWHKDEAGNLLHVKLDDYVEEHAVRVSWAGIDIVNYHRSMADTMKAFLTCGLVLEQFDEPQPSEDALKLHPGYSDYRRVPYFQTMVWRKA